MAGPRWCDTANTYGCGNPATFIVKVPERPMKGACGKHLAGVVTAYAREHGLLAVAVLPQKLS